MSNPLDAVINKAISSIPECLAAGYVDIGSGLLLGIKTVDSHPSSVIEILAAATADLFQGQNVTLIESMFKKARGVDDGRHYFQEIIVNSDNLVHLFIRGRKHPDYVCVFVSRNTVNLGMMLAKSRLSVPSFEETM